MTAPSLGHAVRGVGTNGRRKTGGSRVRPRWHRRREEGGRRVRRRSVALGSWSYSASDARREPKRTASDDERVNRSPEGDSSPSPAYSAGFSICPNSRTVTVLLLLEEEGRREKNETAKEAAPASSSSSSSTVLSSLAFVRGLCFLGVGDS